jgi:hypothetical protein
MNSLIIRLCALFAHSVQAMQKISAHPVSSLFFFCLDEVTILCYNLIVTRYNCGIPIVLFIVS